MRISLLTLILMVVLFASPAHAEVAAKVLSVQGRVEVFQSAWTPASVNQILEVGTTIRTLDQSRAVILLADETQIKLNSNSQLVLKEARRTSDLTTRVMQTGGGSDQSLLDLLKGEAWLRSKKTPAQLKVNTPAVTAAVRGTEFTVKVAADGETSTTVLEGSVDFRNDQGSVLLKAREQGHARVGEAPTKTVILNPEDAVQWTLYYTAAVSPRDYWFVMPTPAQAKATLTAAVADPIRVAQLQHDAGNLQQALTALQGLTTAQASEVRGWIYLEQNRIQDALAEFQHAPREGPRVRLGLSLAHYRAGNLAEAYRYVQEPGTDDRLRLQKAMLELLAGDPAEARHNLETVVQGSPSFGLNQGLLSNVYLIQNRKDDALAAAQRAIAASPDSPSVYLSLSLVQQSLFDLPAATRSVERALTLDPEFLQAEVQYAELLFGAGNSSKAEEVIRRAISRAPQEAGAHSVLGFILLGQGKTQEARSAFETALRQDNALGKPHLGLGVAEMRAGRYREAVAEFLTAATLEPRISLYQSYLGKAFYEQRKFEQAFTALQAARDLDPRDPTPLLYSGIFKNDLNRPGEAVHDLEQSIELNDNRAVYRSRFVLDEDRATRNVNLATSYNRLGLSEWANLAALKSSLADPANSSAHLFLGATFLNLKGRTQAAGDELLMARLLLPVNANSFNAFNDYTTLFELPRMNWTVEGSTASFDSRGTSLVASGGAGRWAYSSVLRFDRTQGFRPQNDDQHNYTGVNLLKLAFSPHSDLLLSYVHDQARSGDHGAESPFVSEENNSLTRRAHTRTDRAEIGYHRQFRPGSDLLLLFSGQKDDFLTEDPKAGLIRFPPYPPVDVQLRHSSRSPDLDLQAGHLLKISQLQFRYGVDFFEGRARVQENFIFRNPASQDLIVQELEPERNKVRFKTVFLQSDYQVQPNLLVTAGLNYDWASFKFAATEREDPVSRWNPHLGVLYDPSDSTTLRLSVARAMQTHQQARLAPAQVEGFALGQNDFPLTESTSVDLGWDQRLGRDSFLRTTTFKKARRIPFLDTLPSGDQGRAYLDGSFYGGTMTLNQFITECWTVVPGYTLTHSRDLYGLRHDHEFNVEARYVGSRGLSFAVAENYLHQNGLVAGDLTRTRVFTTHATIAYEFPRKTGLIALQVKNLTDRRYSFLVDPLALEPRVPRRQVSLLLRFNL